MTASECITGRRSIRSFTDEPVAESLIREIVDEAAFAPSWKNSQIARYIAVTGDTKEALSACTSGYARNGEIMRKAPMVVAVTFVKNRSGFERDGSMSTPKGRGFEYIDAGIAVEAFCLAAYSHGLGTVIMGIYDEDRAAEVLGVPQDQEIAVLIPIGYPAESPTAPKRKDSDALLTLKA